MENVKRSCVKEHEISQFEVFDAIYDLVEWRNMINVSYLNVE